MYVYTKELKQRSFATKLARALRCLRVSPENKGVPRRSNLLNWGCSIVPNWFDPRLHNWIGNRPQDIKTISNKTHMFKAMTRAGVRCLDATDSKAEAQRWLDDGHTVYQRAVLTGHSGAGISVVEKGGALDDVPLYTKAIRKRFSEFRVHVFGGKVICVQRKRQMSTETAKERGVVLPDKKLRTAIRTYGNGWVFCVNDVDEPAGLRPIAIDAMNAVGGVMGAVDILTTKDGENIVIETNSAPALRSPTVLRAYRDAIRGADIARGAL